MIFCGVSLSKLFRRNDAELLKLRFNLLCNELFNAVLSRLLSVKLFLSFSSLPNISRTFDVRNNWSTNEFRDRQKWWFVWAAALLTMSEGSNPFCFSGWGGGILLVDESVGLNPDHDRAGTARMQINIFVEEQRVELLTYWMVFLFLQQFSWNITIWLLILITLVPFVVVDPAKGTLWKG